MCLAMYFFTDIQLKETHYDHYNPSMYIENINNVSNEYENVL